MAANRCAWCGDVVGVYEPMVFVIDDEPLHSSLAARPDLAVTGATRYHRDCYETPELAAGREVCAS